MLTHRCQVQKGGYSEDIVDKTLEYVRDNYRVLKEVSPRNFIKIADTIETYPNHWKMVCDNSLISK